MEYSSETELDKMYNDNCYFKIFVSYFLVTSGVEEAIIDKIRQNCGLKTFSALIFTHLVSFFTNRTER